MKTLLALCIILSIIVINKSSVSENHPVFLQCPQHYFKVKGMLNCNPWLSCSDIPKIKILKLLDSGAVKDVFLALWEEHFVTVSRLKNPQFANDFQHGLNMLQLLNPSRYVVQLLGFCEKNHILVTEYYQRGNAINITDIIKTMAGDNIIKRLNLCLNYAQILNYIHNSPGGTRVFCDSNDLYKLLSQLLITEEIMLVLNDVDALPEVTPKGILCGRQELKGSFVAPEQLWHHNGSFSITMMSGYDEKTDIWKAAAVCNHFLRDIEDRDIALYRLFDIHRQCRNEDPSKRPTARDLIAEYVRVIKELGEHEEL